MRFASFPLFLCGIALGSELAAQTAVTRPEEKQKEQQEVTKQQKKRAQHASTIELRGEQAFSEKE